MKRRGPILGSIAVVGVFAGVLIAGSAPSPSVGGASPSAILADPVTVVATAGPTTVTADGPITVDPGLVDSTVIESATTLTSIAEVIAEVPTVVDTTPFTAPPDQSYDIPPEVSVDIPVDTEPASEPPIPEPPPDTTPSGPVAVDIATLRVLMANADGRPDLAELTAARFFGLGYGQIATGTAVTPVEYTIVYFREGFNRAAVRVADDLLADSPTLRIMSEEELLTPLTDNDAAGDVIVLLGTDAPA